MPAPATAPALARRDFVGRIAVLLAGLVAFGRPRRAEAGIQSIEPYLGEIMLISCNFAPKGWALCNGQLLPINQNQALFSILGTTYGGNGQTNFALPDLRGRSPLHWGQGPGLSVRTLGELAGELSHTLSTNEMPAHAHVARCSSAAGTSASPVGMVLAHSAAAVPGHDDSADTSLGSGAIASVGGSQPHTNIQPVLALNYVIALQGTFPSP
jgi:microcystin-dependent protein